MVDNSVLSLLWPTPCSLRRDSREEIGPSSIDGIQSIGSEDYLRFSIEVREPFDVKVDKYDELG